MLFAREFYFAKIEWKEKIKDNRINLLKKGEFSEYVFVRRVLSSYSLNIEGDVTKNIKKPINTSGRISLGLYYNEKLIDADIRYQSEGRPIHYYGETRLYFQLCRFNIPWYYLGKTLKMRVTIEKPFIELKEIKDNIYIEVAPIFM